MIGKNDARRKENLKKAEEAVEKAKRERRGADGEIVREIPQVPSHMFFQHNEALVPPYSVLVDTSFFSRTVQMKLPLLETMMDCLYGEFERNQIRLGKQGADLSQRRAIRLSQTA